LLLREGLERVACRRFSAAATERKARPEGGGRLFLQRPGIYRPRVYFNIGRRARGARPNALFLVISCLKMRTTAALRFLFAAVLECAGKGAIVLCDPDL